MAIPTKRHDAQPSPTSTSTEIKALLAAPDRDHLARPPRPRAAAHRDPDRAARLRTRRPARSATSPRHRRARPGHGQRPQGARHDPDQPRPSRSCARWLNERQGQPDDPLFPTRQGRPLSRDAVGVLLAKHTATAAASCPSLPTKRVTPHMLRHTNAMLLRAEGVDIATIALWLGHESTKTTHIYLHADPALKERSDRPNRPARHPTRPIPATRQPPRLPRSTVIMPTSRQHQPASKQENHHHTIPQSA